MDFAASRTHLSPSDFLYERDLEDLRQIVDDAPTPSIQGWVRSPDSRVRALALVALEWKAGPESLPTLAEFVDDAGKAPPERMRHSVSSAVPGRSGAPPWEERPQTVGTVARSIVRFYLEAAGYFTRDEGRELESGFASYWAARRGRKECLSWFQVALLRGSQGTLPTPPERVPKIRDLRRRIEGLESPYRQWVLLALACPPDGGDPGPGSAELATEEERVGAATQLGAPRLMGFLRGEDPFPDDPDMRLRERSPFPYERVAAFLLRNARPLLDPSHAGELLELEERHRAGQTPRKGEPFVSSRWTTAAADLDPVRAREILHAAFERFRGDRFYVQDRRAILAAALWSHGGEEEIGFLADWIFREAPDRGAIGFGRHRFAASLGLPAQRPLLLALLRDPRLGELDIETLRRLAYAANAAAGKTVLSDDDLRKAWHPLGESHYSSMKEEAKRRHPVETQKLEEVLADWRWKLSEFARGAR